MCTQTWRSKELLALRRDTLRSSRVRGALSPPAPRRGQGERPSRSLTALQGEIRSHMWDFGSGHKLVMWREQDGVSVLRGRHCTTASMADGPGLSSRCGPSLCPGDGEGAAEAPCSHGKGPQPALRWWKALAQARRQLLCCFIFLWNRATAESKCAKWRLLQSGPCRLCCSCSWASKRAHLPSFLLNTAPEKVKALGFVTR